MFPGINKNYVFSECVTSDLIEFFTVARTKTDDHPRRNLWAKLLPQNVALLEKLSGLQEEKTEHVIDLTKDSSHTSEKTLLQSQIKLCGSSFTEELGDLIEEKLISENSLSESVVTKLNTKCNESDFKILFDKCKNFDNELLYALGKSLLTYSTIKSCNAAVFYFKYVLLIKLKETQNNNFKLLFEEFLDKLKGIVRCELLKELQVNISKFLLNNLNALDGQHKKTVLRDFIASSSKLEQEHFSMLETLITKEIEIDSLRKLLDMLHIIAGNYSKDKTFGKLLMALVKTSDKNAATFQQQFNDILSKHKSIWTNQIVKVLEAACKHYKTIEK